MNEVDDTKALAHLQALQQIADDNGGNRASPGPGYDASVDHVVDVLRSAGFDVTTPTYEASTEDSEEESDSGSAPVRNVIAQTRTGDPANVVMIGAHLDSVREGPGIVDNGSGVAALLEIATRLGADAPTQNSVRFAFFGSEEEGALGSRAYVDDLPASDREKISLYLNVDMVASPNAGYLVQGGKGDSAAASGPPGSATVGQVLADHLATTGVNPEIIGFVGDDEAPFVEAGIPAGGAENGDRGSKTPAQAQGWGGTPGEPFDRCYHSACDRLDNVNPVVLHNYLRALAGTIGHFASSPDRPGR